jgi:hypothetical protein
MLERKLLVGRYINREVLRGAPVPAYAEGEFVEVPVRQCYLQESTGLFRKESAIIDGDGPKEHRRFKWLPWLAGAISRVDLVEMDVLTGPMSGCWLVAYTDEHGVLHAGHIGTNIDRPDQTAAAKGAWNAFAAAHRDRIVGGFNPLHAWPGAFPAQQDGEQAAEIYGLFTTDGHFYAVFTYVQQDFNLLRIAEVAEVVSATVAELAALFPEPAPVAV